MGARKAKKSSSFLETHKLTSLLVARVGRGALETLGVAFFLSLLSLESQQYRNGT